jgi:hypothetical protein
VQETRRSSSARAVGTWQNENALDDWLGDISYDDWDEQATEQAARRRATPAYRQLPADADELAHDSGSARPPSTAQVAASEKRRALVERRRLAAGVALAVVLGVAIAIPVLLASRGEQGGVTLPTITTTSEPAATSPTSEPDTTTTSPVPESPTTTTPAVDDASSFVLPEGTKLQREGENDPALVSQLQEALAEAGFDAGPADGTFGEQTEAAVVAFQQANGLSVDGRVGPETAEALNQALAGG